jgi:hypothetical protein
MADAPHSAGDGDDSTSARDEIDRDIVRDVLQVPPFVL